MEERIEYSVTDPEKYEGERGCSTLGSVATCSIVRTCTHVDPQLRCSSFELLQPSIQPCIYLFLKILIEHACCAFYNRIIIHVRLLITI